MYFYLFFHNVYTVLSSIPHGQGTATKKGEKGKRKKRIEKKNTTSNNTDVSLCWRGLSIWQESCNFAQIRWQCYCFGLHLMINFPTGEYTVCSGRGHVVITKESGQRFFDVYWHHNSGFACYKNCTCALYVIFLIRIVWICCVSYIFSNIFFLNIYFKKLFTFISLIDFLSPMMNR